MSAGAWTLRRPPQGGIGIDTQFRGRRRQLCGLRTAAQHTGVGKVESIDRCLNYRVARECTGQMNADRRTPLAQRTARAGCHSPRWAVVLLPDGYDNVIHELSSSATRVLYRQPMPVPVSMWQPWRHSVSDGSLGAHAYFFENAVVNVAGIRVVPLICYEQLLIWPTIQSMLNAPEEIIAIANGWWTSDTIVAVKKASVAAWARLFEVKLLFAANSSTSSSVGL